MQLYHLHASESVTPSEVDLAFAREAAVELIIMAGFDGSDSDHLGDEMGSTVQTLLTVVMLRCPQLADRILGKDNIVQIVQEEF